MHNIPLDILAAFVGVYAALQALSVFLASMNVAEKQIEGRSKWVAKDGTVFEEFAVTEIETSNVLKHDFEESSSESILAGLSHSNG